MLPFLFATTIILSACQTPPTPAPQPAPKPAPAPAPGPTPGQTPATGQTPAAPGKAIIGKVFWSRGNLEKTLAKAKEANKLVFADFKAGWCQFCTKMDREVYSTDEVGAAVEGVMCITIDYDKERDVADRYLVGNTSLPVAIWFNPDGTVRERIDGFQDKNAFVANAARIKADIGTINEVRRKIDANPADVDLRYELHRRLKAVGDAAGAAQQRAAIEKADPQGESRPMHHFKYDALMDAIHVYWAQTKQLDPKQIEGLRNFLEVENDPEILWDGWMSLSNTYQWYGEQAQARGESAEAKKNRSIQRDCLARAWRGIPQDDDTLHLHVTGYAALFWDLRDELSADDKKLLLAMTEMVAHRPSFDADALVQDLYARALFLSGKTDAAQAAAERAIEVAKATGVDPQDYQKTLDLIRGGK